MAVVTDTITKVQDQVLETLSSVQAPVVDLVAKAVDAVDGVVPESLEIPYIAELPQPAELVELGFGFAEKLLANQYDFAKAVVNAISPLLPEAPKIAKPKAAPKQTISAA